MKKLLLCAVAAMFMFGCSSDTTSEDPVADLKKAVANYNDACSDAAFTNTRGTIKQIDDAMVNNDRKEADRLYVVAKDDYDKDLAKYTQLVNASDKANTTMKDQKSRMSAVKSEVSAADYNATNSEVNALHKQAEDALKKCDVAAANRYLADADRKIRALEAKAGKTTGEYYKVQKGDSLWKIASSKYSDPYLWPLIYWSNKNSIKDPDLIYPNQEFLIEHGQSDSEKNDASKFSKTRGPWSLYDGK